MENKDMVIEEIVEPELLLQNAGSSTTETITGKDGTTVTKISNYYSEAEFKLYKMAILLLGGIVILTVIGVIFLALMGKTIPESVIVIGSVAIGALAGVLAPSQTKPSAQTTTTTPINTTPINNGK